MEINVEQYWLYKKGELKNIMNSKNLIDCIVTIKELEIGSKAEHNRLAELFGLVIIDESQINVSSGHKKILDEEFKELPEKKENREIKKNIVRTPSPKPIEKSGDSLQSKIKLVKRTKPVTPSLTQLDEAPLAEVEKFENRLPMIQSLFDPKLKRQISFGVGALHDNKGSIDEKKLVKKVLENKPLLKIPKRNKPVIPNRIQLLIDVSEAMDPYLKDIDVFEKDLHDVIGNSKIEKLYFSLNPLRGVGVNAVRWYDYAKCFLPYQGTKVICISNFGRGYHSFSDIPTNIVEWVQFYNVLKKSGNSLAILTPYNLKISAQMQLFRQLNIIYWDRKTIPSKMLSHKY